MKLVLSTICVIVLSLLLFGANIGDGMQTILRGAFGGEVGWARTMVNMTPLILTGLGVTVAWRSGMYNIGGEGQYISGGLLGAAAARMHMGGPWIILMAAAVGGALCGGIAGWLQVKRGVHAAISTILLNFVAIQALAWAVTGPLQAKGTTASQTEELAPTQMLARFSTRTDLHLGVFLSVVLAILIWAYLSFTRPGFQLRLTGENPYAARASRLDADRIRLQAMALSGALCGLAGGVQFAGVSGVIDIGFNQQWGFLGIPVALLGGLNALGVILSSFLFGGLMAGTQSLSRSLPGGDLLIFVIQGAAVLAYLYFQKKREVVHA